MNVKVFCNRQVRTHPLTTIVSPTRPNPPSSPALMSAILNLLLNLAMGEDDEEETSALSSKVASVVSATFVATILNLRPLHKLGWILPTNSCLPLLRVGANTRRLESDEEWAGEMAKEAWERFERCLRGRRVHRRGREANKKGQRAPATPIAIAAPSLCNNDKQPKPSLDQNLNVSKTSNESTCNRST